MFRFYIYAQLAQCLRAFITAWWTVLENSSFHQQSNQSFYHYTTFQFTISFLLKAVNVYQKVHFQLVQTLFSIRRKIRRSFEPNIRRWLLLSQHFGHFTVPPTNSSSKQRIQQKVFCIQSVSFLRFEVTAAIYPQGRSQHFRKGNLVSTRQFGWISQIFWSSKQSIADSITQNKIWDWIYKSKRRTVQSLLQGYSCKFKQTISIIVSVWKEQDLRLFHPKVWTLRWSIHRSCQPG